MYMTNISEVEEEIVEIQGVEKTSVQWLINEKAGAENFAMRRFTMKAQGIIPLHTHDWEHEVYVLKGKGTVLYEDQERPVGENDVIFVPPAKTHGFLNDSDDDFVFLCLIPITK
jgi:quercetin dioxygenase-like cupin family protein